MPRIALIGTASTGSFGFGVGGLPSTVSTSYVIVGGVGAGDGFSGGGGGNVLVGATSLSVSTSYTVTCGPANGSSVFNGITAGGGSAAGGGRGGSCNGYVGGNTDTAWGDYVIWPPTYAPWESGGYAFGGGGGAGFGGAGSSAYDSLPGSYYIFGGDGGPGWYSSVMGEYYGGGQGGTWMSVSNTDGPQNNGTNGPSGVGFDTFGSDGRGGVVLQYTSIIQLWTGGTVTSSGSGAAKKWKHKFSASSTLAHIY